MVEVFLTHLSCTSRGLRHEWSQPSKIFCAACQKSTLFANYEKTLGYELGEQLDWEHPDVIPYQTDRPSESWKAVDEMGKFQAGS